MSDIIHVETIGEAVNALGLEEPKHPLIYTLKVQDFDPPEELKKLKATFGYYQIWLKDANCAIQYGRNTYDFNEGVLSFYAPNQVLSSNGEGSITATEGWALFVHPDLIRKSPLGETIKNYNFFSYEVHEALHLSKKEEDILNDCVKKIDFELDQNIDGHSQQLLISNIELLLNYCNRFYERQFHTRSDHHKDVVTQIEYLVRDYFDKGLQLEEPLSTSYLAENVNLSANYLGDLLKKETGKNTKEHINDFIVNEAKNLLLRTESNVSEIAYDLGFNYPHYFSRLFKQKTGKTPQQYRESQMN